MGSKTERGLLLHGLVSEQELGASVRAVGCLDEHEVAQSPGDETISAARALEIFDS